MTNNLFSFTGPASSGKSTLLKLCKDEFGSKFTYVEEITRKVKAKGLPINEQGNDLTQLLINNAHLENSLLKNAILDRCILDGLVYTHYLECQNSVSYWVLEYTKNVYNLLIPKYDVIFYCEPVTLENDGVRSINEYFRNATIQYFEISLKEDSRLKDKVVRLTGSVEQRMSIIKETLTRYC